MNILITMCGKNQFVSNKDSELRSKLNKKKDPSHVFEMNVYSKIWHISHFLLDNTSKKEIKLTRFSKSI